MPSQHLYPILLPRNDSFILAIHFVSSLQASTRNKRPRNAPDSTKPHLVSRHAAHLSQTAPQRRIAYSRIKKFTNSNLVNEFVNDFCNCLIFKRNGGE